MTATERRRALLETLCKRRFDTRGLRSSMCACSATSVPRAIIGIAAVVLAYAGLLTAVVINTLTTTNISERERGIATLMVLDYHDYEICGYIYREIYISTFLGILLGYPVGVWLATLVFKTIGFGTVANVSWFMWLFVPLIVFGFTLPFSALPCS